MANADDIVIMGRIQDAKETFTALVEKKVNWH
jgi:hypothetical protein